ncbi:uncharacterized protein LOC130138510 [Syzygium oleosum]|uniref:uncharacterized protein LOC130138510 n=1 Tax=Syzygium oleosum TaxID=219896 RepID=UPI0024B9111F|nr:uncharacterized protein LOC130138510 [Syzygium oleosum]
MWKNEREGCLLCQEEPVATQSPGGGMLGGALSDSEAESSLAEKNRNGKEEKGEEREEEEEKEERRGFCAARTSPSRFDFESQRSVFKCVGSRNRCRLVFQLFKVLHRDASRRESSGVGENILIVETFWYELHMDVELTVLSFLVDCS